MTQAKKVYPKGIYFNEPHEKAPKFIVGNISIQVDNFQDFLNENSQYINEKGYIRFNVLEKKEKDDFGKYNVLLDTYKSEGKSLEEINKQIKENDEIDLDEIPL